jgi:hypothetical protein
MKGQKFRSDSPQRRLVPLSVILFILFGCVTTTVQVGPFTEEAPVPADTGRLYATVWDALQSAIRGNIAAATDPLDPTDFPRLDGIFSMLLP